MFFNMSHQLFENIVRILIPHQPHVRFQDGLMRNNGLGAFSAVSARESGNIKCGFQSQFSIICFRIHVESAISNCITNFVSIKGQFLNEGQYLITRRLNILIKPFNQHPAVFVSHGTEQINERPCRVWDNASFVPGMIIPFGSRGG